MFCRRKFTLGMFQQTVRNYCPKFLRNERKSVKKLNVRNKTSEIFFASNVLVVSICEEHFRQFPENESHKIANPDREIKSNQSVNYSQKCIYCYLF